MRIVSNNPYLRYEVYLLRYNSLVAENRNRPITRYMAKITLKISRFSSQIAEHRHMSRDPIAIIFTWHMVTAIFDYFVTIL